MRTTSAGVSCARAGGGGTAVVTTSGDDVASAVSSAGIGIVMSTDADGISGGGSRADHMSAPSTAACATIDAAVAQCAPTRDRHETLSAEPVG
jgi:hypothetical protein